MSGWAGTVPWMDADGLFALDDADATTASGRTGAPQHSSLPKETAIGFDTVRADAPLAVRMRPQTVTELVGQDHLLAPGAPLRQLVGEHHSDLGDHVGSARHRQDDDRPPRRDRHQPGVRGAVGSQRRRERRPRRDRQGSRGSTPGRPADGPVHRRGAPVLQDPAGFAAGRRRGPHRHAARRDDGEPLLLSDLAAVVPMRAPHAQGARRKRGPRSDPPRDHRRTRPRRFRDARRARPRTTWCGSRPATSERR